MSVFQSTLSLRRATVDLCIVPEIHGISIHALLAESDQKAFSKLSVPVISIHALLAESDFFLLPCTRSNPISIHALLAESDQLTSALFRKSTGFQSTLSLRRATGGCRGIAVPPADFNPRSPCGERRSVHDGLLPGGDISIHALLAESDSRTFALYFSHLHFNPRSPCGERRSTLKSAKWIPQFQSTLSLRRATDFMQGLHVLARISIHALLAESDCPSYPGIPRRDYFNPRSPCGERLKGFWTLEIVAVISIHALLAESDDPGVWPVPMGRNFNPRSPCGERPD